MKIRVKKAVSLFLAFVLVIITLCSCNNSDDETNKTVSPTTEVQETTKPTPTHQSQVYEISSLNKCNVSDILLMGTYEQDNNLENGKEQIEWIVLAKEENKILLISRYCIDAKQFYTKQSNIDWEKSSIRGWLNNEFMLNTFSSNEQSKILLTSNKKHENPTFSTKKCPDSEEKIFLLSIDEARMYFTSTIARVALPTEYAKSNGINYVNEKGSVWWLRTPGMTETKEVDGKWVDTNKSFCAVTVSNIGAIQLGGEYVNYDNVGIRPAMWISLT